MPPAPVAVCAREKNVQHFVIEDVRDHAARNPRRIQNRADGNAVMDLVKMPQAAPTAAGPPAQLLDVQLVIEVLAVQLLKNLPERMMPALGRIYELAPSLQAPPSKPSLQFRVPSKLLVDFLHVPRSTLQASRTAIASSTAPGA